MAYPKNSEEVNSVDLRAYVGRIERLETEKQTFVEDIKSIYGEAKAAGFDVKILRKVIALRKQDRDKRIADEATLELYLGALGMLATTPLGQAAVARDFPSQAKV